MTPEENRARCKAYYELNRERLKQKALARYSADSERIKPKVRDYWHRRGKKLRQKKQKARERRRAYYHTHREQIIAKVKDYYRAHHAQMIEKSVERNRKRRRRLGIQPRQPGVPKLRVLRAVKEQPFVREQPKGWTDKEWWKIPKEELPRRWILEAA